MQVKEFFDTFEGLWVETNRGEPATNEQCVDLWRAYNKKVIGGPFMLGNAVDFWTIYPVDFYDKIPNTPTAVPRLGDVIIWGTTYGKYGHIAICTDIADTKGFTSFDQNDPLNSSCHYQPHKYTGVLGWLRPKHLPQDVNAEDQTAINILKQGLEGSLEGFVRQLVGEHANYKSLEDKAKQFDGFVIKWVAEYNLPQGSGIVQIEVEMDKLIPLEDRVNKFREAIESAVGSFTTDEALLEGLSTLRGENSVLTTKLSECELKLQNGKAFKTIVLGKYKIKIYKI
jgi:hypothetical protein